MTIFEFNEMSTPAIGDFIQLQGQTCQVVRCEVSGVKMLNIDADELMPGDLKFIKSLGLTISNPDTDKPVALGEDFVKDTVGSRIHRYLSSHADSEEEDEDDDDDDFFSSVVGGSFIGGLSSGGFGGFGGGGFGGGGISRGF